jgi:hypothetical protein
MIESRQLAWPAYLVSLGMIFLPLSDVATSLYPWRFMDARWRFGAVGLVSNALLIPVVGLFLALVMSTLLDHRVLRRTIGILCGLGAVICLVAAGLFGLDALQTRANVPPQMHASFTVATLAAAFKTLLAIATLAALSVAALRRRSNVEVKQRGVPLFSVETAPAQPGAAKRPSLGP